MAIQKFHVSADIQEGRGIVDLAEEARILGFLPGEQLAAGLLSLSHFLCRSAHRLAGMDGLSDGGGKMLRLQGRQGGIEHAFGAAEFAEKFACHTGAKTGSKGEGDPPQVLFGFHEAERENPTSVRSGWRRCQLRELRRCEAGSEVLKTQSGNLGAQPGAAWEAVEALLAVRFCADGAVSGVAGPFGRVC